jgi:hypothetical protein
VEALVVGAICVFADLVLGDNNIGSVLVNAADENNGHRTVPVCPGFTQVARQYVHRAHREAQNMQRYTRALTSFKAVVAVVAARRRCCQLTDDA